jgi:hypothetical protein
MQVANKKERNEMCAPASFVVTKDKIYWSKKSDSHEEIISEYELHADGVRGANIVRVEITPVGGDFRLPLNEWNFKVDQDETPKWFDKEAAENRVRLELPNWLASKIILPGQEIDELKDGHILACYGSINKVCDSASINYVCGSASINKVCGSASINKVCGSASINYVCGSASIKEVCGSASINYVYDSASINYVCGSASIKEVCGSASIKEVCDSASIKEVCGSASINKVCDSASINKVCDSASINKVCGSAVVTAYKQLDLSILQSNGAVLIIRDYSANRPTVYVGIQETS